MASPTSLLVLDADTGCELVSDCQPSDRDLEYSLMLHYLIWGRFHTNYPDGVFATLPNGKPAPPALAIPPLDLTVHTAALRRPITDAGTREAELTRRKWEYKQLAKDAYVVAARRSTQTTRTPSHVPSTATDDRASTSQKQPLRKFQRESKQTFAEKVEQVTLLVDAKSRAAEKLAYLIKYLQDLGYDGQAQLNLLLNKDHQELEDLPVPAPFEETVNRLHHMSIDEARHHLTYEGLWDFLQRPRTLRIKALRIQQRLVKVAALIDLPDESEASRARKIDAGITKYGPELRDVYAEMVALSDDMEAHMISLKEQKTSIPKKLLQEWQSADAAHKETIMKQQFAQGMTSKEQVYLDRTHFTRHFKMMRALVSLTAGDTLCEHLGDFGKGLRETRDEL
ncbi:hypothetical protein BKA63DRAFT_571243 [Paraphoma chrysanthemicola]|nr:hypothetical protein BKA63DRAFT_571243 [Paraphoma chrysanthemicola]